MNDLLQGLREGPSERDEWEGPRHGVRLTAGYWLAETACTQALWQAVMGGNPSAFRDNPSNPVEQVSWDEVISFLQRVEAVLPGVDLRLPTEAEWEYACRAGSGTPFNCGNTIAAARANYDGNYPYAGGDKDLHRKKTVPVKTFAPNAWGLYQMHGNVWEWCADGMRDYGAEVQENPRGTEGDWAARVVRGGSWYSGAWRLRSAYRLEGPRLPCGDHRGFRFSLRTIRQVAGALRT